MSRVIVTGGAGFIGGHVARALNDLGHQVLVADPAWTATHGLPGTNLDVSDRDAVDRVFAEFRPDAVMHLAGVADARAVLKDPVTAVQVNIGGTTVLLEAAARHAVGRTVIAGSCWVYNAMREDAVDETEPFQPTGAGHVYTTTMITKELLAQDFRRLHGVSSTVLRYSPIYGPGMWGGLALAAFLDQARAGGPVVVFGDGTEKRAFLHVTDLAGAFCRALAPVADGQVYNLQGPEVLTVGELADLVARRFGVEVERREEPTRRGELVYGHRTVSCEKAERELGWRATITIEQGIDTVLEAAVDGQD